MKGRELRGRTAALPLPPATNYSQTSKKAKGGICLSPGLLPFQVEEGNLNGQEEETPQKMKTSGETLAEKLGACQ